MTPMEYTIKKAKDHAKRDVDAGRKANSGAKGGSAYHVWYMSAYTTYNTNTLAAA